MASYKRINRDNIGGGMAGRRPGDAKPTAAVIHNDYGAMTPEDYEGWLIARKKRGQMNLGYA